jgi:quercetin dioxygenase-like cupin family protein
MQRRTFLSSTVAVPSLLVPEVPAPTNPAPFVVKAGQSRFGEKTRLMGVSPNDIKVSTRDSGTTLSVLEYTGRGKGGPPLHIHRQQDEMFYVLAGEYLFEVGGERHRLAAGDLIFLPRGVPHTFAQLTDEGRMLFLLQPAGKMEDYFRALGKVTSVTPQEGARLFADHEMEVVGPPLPVD